MLTVCRAPRRRVAIPALLGSLESVVALVLAHVAAGGEVPAPWWLAGFAVLVYGAGSVVLRHRASIRLVLPLLLAGQVLGHAWLVTLSPGGHADHVHGSAALLGLTPAMLLAHVAAAAVTGAMWLLRRRAVEVLLHWSDPGVLLVPAPRRIHRRPPHRVRTPRDHRALAPTRGPPAGSLAIA